MVLDENCQTKMDIFGEAIDLTTYLEYRQKAVKEHAQRLYNAEKVLLFVDELFLYNVTMNPM